MQGSSERIEPQSELESRFRSAKLRSMRYVAAKTLELIGMVVVFAGLLAGLGLTQDGQASMGKELLLLGIGGMVFTFGWLLERGSRA